jgi:hypothetical protein
MQQLWQQVQAQVQVQQGLVQQWYLGHSRLQQQHCKEQACVLGSWRSRLGGSSALGI